MYTCAGVVVRSGVYRFDTAEAVLVIPNVASAPDYLSFARDWSFFGIHHREVGPVCQVVDHDRKTPISLQSDVITNYHYHPPHRVQDLRSPRCRHSLIRMWSTACSPTAASLTRSRLSLCSTC